MSTGLYSHTTRATGTVLTSAIYNSDHQNHITNLNPTMAGAYSDTVGQMQTMADPGGLGSEVLAGNLAAELEALRFCIARITGETHWYEAPATNLAGAGGSDPLHLAFAATPLTLRRTENTTAEVEVRSVQSGSGVGNKFSTRILGSAANAVAEIREYLGTTELWRQVAALKTNQTIQHFNAGWTLGISGASTIIGNISGFFDFLKITTPANPPANTARLYCRDLGGGTRLCYRDSGGNEQILTTSPTVPGTIVEGVRLGTQVLNSSDANNPSPLSSGNVLTGFTPAVTDKSPTPAKWWHRPVQTLIAGNWASVSSI